MGLPTYLTDRVPLGIVDTHMWHAKRKAARPAKAGKRASAGLTATRRWRRGRRHYRRRGRCTLPPGRPILCRCWCGRQSWSTRQITSSAAATTVHCRKVKSCGRKCRRSRCWAGSPFYCWRGRASCAGSHPGDQSCAGRVEERQRCRATGELHPSGRNWGAGSGKAVVWWRLTNKAVTILDRGGGSD